MKMLNAKEIKERFKPVQTIPHFARLMQHTRYFNFRVLSMFNL
jgi:hypothetical protein